MPRPPMRTIDSAEEDFFTDTAEAVYNAVQNAADTHSLARIRVEPKILQYATVRFVERFLAFGQEGEREAVTEVANVFKELQASGVPMGQLEQAAEALLEAAHVYARTFDSPLSTDEVGAREEEAWAAIEEEGVSVEAMFKLFNW